MIGNKFPNGVSQALIIHIVAGFKFAELWLSCQMPSIATLAYCICFFLKETMSLTLRMKGCSTDKLFPLYWMVLVTLLLQQGLTQPVAKREKALKGKTRDSVNSSTEHLPGWWSNGWRSYQLICHQAKRRDNFAPQCVLKPKEHLIP